MKLKTIIPSLDRAAQLHLLLSSLRENFCDYENLQTIILYRASLGSFQQGYAKLMTECPLERVRWIEEKSFDSQIKDELQDDDYVMFLVDDCIFYRKYEPTIKETLDLITDDTFCFSFRLGLNTTTQYYVTGQQQDPLDKLGYQLTKERYPKWNFKVRNPNENYGYNFSWDGHIYRQKDIYDICKNFSFHNPRSLESQMVQPKVRESLQRKYMVSDEVGHIFVNTVNCSQLEKIPSGLFHNYSLEYLNEKYLNGEVISLEDFDFNDEVIKGCHGELPIKFKKQEPSA